ncbi:GPI-anchored surface protein, putative [Bodo saltans]|uniref:GPI-anchored surface protein, putative n=1 Tax=Bodo saltans TaxID=75058 RepID=A0A0S4JFA7_BODSA|nr:GPI-anchored surface protein, putative [Bodo saltans]|eukprot:CUG90090.1 GPI-anchored surface protein, putative [Bodo saltans]
MWQPLCVTIVWVAIIWALALVPMLLSATLVIIPCDPNMTNYTTTLMSNTDYLIQDCTLSPDSSSSDGGGNWMPPMHRFTALLSAPENATISNVDIVVRGGNVVFHY